MPILSADTDPAGVASVGFGARVVLLLLFGIITSSISQNKAFVKVFVRTYFQPLPPLLGGIGELGDTPKPPAGTDPCNSLRPSPYLLWQRGSQGDSDRCATLASPFIPWLIHAPSVPHQSTRRLETLVPVLEDGVSLHAKYTYSCRINYVVLRIHQAEGEG